MKYSVHYKVMIACTLVLTGATIESILDNMPTLGAMLVGITLFFFMGTVAAPDNEKYSDEYNKKRKGL